MSLEQDDARLLDCKEVERKLSETERRISSTSEKLMELGSFPEKKHGLTTELENAAALHNLLEMDNLKLEVEISRHIPRFSLVNEGIGLAALQSRLETDTAFLEYIFLPRQSQTHCR